MSEGNGVIRIGRKGIKKFAFGEDGKPFLVDVVTAYERWMAIDNALREDKEDRLIPLEELPIHRSSAIAFVKELSGEQVTPAEAIDFTARLKEEYDKLADFFQPKSLDAPDSPDTSGAELRFSEEPAENLPPSTS